MIVTTLPRLIRVGIFFASASLVACAAGETPDDQEVRAEVSDPQVDSLMAPGGCSNAQIRTLQAGCRSSCENGSYGIDHCYPGTMTAGANVFLDVSEGGICVCR